MFMRQGSSTYLLDAVRIADKSILGLGTKTVWEKLLVKDLGKNVGDFSGITHIGILGSRAGSIDNPGLGTRDGDTTADHTLSLTRSDGSGNATDGDVGWQVVHSNEGSQSPVGTRAEENGTSLATHGDGRSSCPEFLKERLKLKCTESTEQDCEGQYRRKR